VLTANSGKTYAETDITKQRCQRKSENTKFVLKNILTVKLNLNNCFDLKKNGDTGTACPVSAAQSASSNCEAELFKLQELLKKRLIGVEQYQAAADKALGITFTFCSKCKSLDK
jgi:hypothetical protein